VKALAREYDRLAMRPARRRVVVGVAAIATAVIVVVLAASGGAGARPAGRSRWGPGPIAHVAFPSNGGSETANDTIPAGGSGQIATDQLPNTVSRAEIDIKPQVSGQADYNQLEVFLAPQHIQDRLMSCFALSLAAFKGLNPKKGINVAFTDENSVLPYLFLVMCISMALDINFPPAADHAGAAAASCQQFAFAAPVKITRVGGMYVGKVSGKVVTPGGRLPIAVSCKRTGRTLAIMIKPRRRGQPLRKTYGSNLGIELVNPTKRSIPVTATFTAH
jgi:hypothetical protein